MGNFHFINHISLQMAPTKSNEKNPCCLNLCNAWWFVFFMGVTMPCNILWSLFGQYDTFWIWWRGWAMEPPYVTAWDRLAGPAVGGRPSTVKSSRDKRQSSTRSSSTTERTRVLTSREKREGRSTCDSN